MTLTFFSASCFSGQFFARFLPSVCWISEVGILSLKIPSVAFQKSIRVPVADSPVWRLTIVLCVHGLRAQSAFKLRVCVRACMTGLTIDSEMVFEKTWWIVLLNHWIRWRQPDPRPVGVILRAVRCVTSFENLSHKSKDFLYSKNPLFDFLKFIFSQFESRLTNASRTGESGERHFYYIPTPVRLDGKNVNVEIEFPSLKILSEPLRDPLAKPNLFKRSFSRIPKVTRKLSLIIYLKLVFWKTRPSGGASREIFHAVSACLNARRNVMDLSFGDLPSLIRVGRGKLCSA